MFVLLLPSLTPFHSPTPVSTQPITRSRSPPPPTPAKSLTQSSHLKLGLVLPSTLTASNHFVSRPPSIRSTHPAHIRILRLSTLFTQTITLTSLFSETLIFSYCFSVIVMVSRPKIKSRQLLFYTTIKHTLVQTTVELACCFMQVLILSTNKKPRWV